MIIIDNNYGDLGSFTLFEDDTKLAYIIWRPKVKSKLVVYDLLSFSKEELIIDGFIWDSKLIKVLQSQKYICMSDPNSDNWNVNIVLIDSESKTIENLVLESEVGNICNYDFRSKTHEISYSINVFSNSSELIGSKIYSYNLENQETSILIEHLNGIEMTWAPNCEDYAYLWRGNIFINENGIDKQVTTYPGEDSSPNFSLDGKEITFSSRRRGEVQIGKLKLH